MAAKAVRVPKGFKIKSLLPLRIGIKSQSVLPHMWFSYLVLPNIEDVVGGEKNVDVSTAAGMLLG